jgi:hypothetical protein
MTKAKIVLGGIAGMLLMETVLTGQAAPAQCENKSGFAKRACEVAAGNGAAVNSGLSGSALEKFKGAPLSTDFSDTIHLDTLPPDIEPKAFRPLTGLERTDDGAFILKTGIYEVYAQSYALDVGGGARVGGFYPAPIKGRRAKVIADVLKQIELHPDVPQSDVQQLLLAIVQGTDLEKMPPPLQQTAAKVLPRETLSLLQGSVVAKAVEKTLLGMINRRLSGGAQARQNGANTDQKNAGGAPTESNGSGAPSSPDSPVLRGTWAQMPGRFYVRYLPEGYAKVRLQVIVPDAAMKQADPAQPLTFDPTEYLAVYAGAPAQRLGISLRPAK